MSSIIFKNDSGKELSTSITGWMKFFLPGCLLGVPLLFGMWLGHNSNEDKVGFFLDLNAALEQELHRQKEEVEDARLDASQQIQGMSVRLAEMQARLVRIEALGERLTSMASLSDGEFDFTSPPAVGGSEYRFDGAVSDTDLMTRLDKLDFELADRQMQLSLLNDLLLDRDLHERSLPTAFPVKQGWISSRYGNRTDPFTGVSAWHNGVDIAGVEGTEVLAVGAGVVSRSSFQEGLGYLVEVTHDGGFVTRYGHNKEITVEVGALVNKGDPIAIMGSTGRSTGPHVHLEVFKNGRSVDPASYIRRYTR